MRNRLLFLCLALTGAPCRAFEAYGIVPPDILLKFDTQSPQQVTAADIAGLVAGDVPVGADIRPSDGRMYAITRRSDGTGKLYRIGFDGAAQLVGTLSASPVDFTNPYTSLPDTSYGVDFDPVLDVIRVTSATRLNLRILPANATVLTDTPLDPAQTGVQGSAYANNRPGAAAATLYAIDVASDDLLLQEPENSGALTPVGTLGLGVNADTAQFDIVSTDRDYGFAAMNAGGVTRLFAIDFVQGRANLIGSIGLNPGLVSLGIVRPDEVFANGFE